MHLIIDLDQLVRDSGVSPSTESEVAVASSAIVSSNCKVIRICKVESDIIAVCSDTIPTVICVL